MGKYHVQVYHRIWHSFIIEASCKSEARQLAREGEGEGID